MPSCLWCEAQISPKALTCPGCGLADPLGPTTELSGLTAASRRRSPPILVPLMVAVILLLAALAFGPADIRLLPGLAARMDAPAAAGALAAAPARYHDPLQQAVWVDGMRAARQALHGFGGTAVGQSFVKVAAGHIVTFCGVVGGAGGTGGGNGGGLAGSRFLSIFGQSAATLIEGSDPSFEVLWARLCAPAGPAA